MTDVVVVGRVMADIYPTEVGVPLRKQQRFVRYVGGFAGNVCTGLSRLQVANAIVSKVGADGHGEFIRDFLAREGVDVRWLATDARLHTPVVFCEIFPPERFPVVMYREPTCPDWELSVDDFDLEAVLDAPIVLLGGTGFAREPSRRTHEEVIRRHRHRLLCDLDYRPSFWPTASAYREAVQPVLGSADIIVGNEDEVRAATGTDDATLGVKQLLATGIKVAVLKRGGNGTMLFEGDRMIEIAPVKVEVVNGLGAGDAFLAALTQGLICDIPIETAVRRANWAGAWVAGQLPCSEAMPYLRNVEQAMQEAVTS
jgi:5-dehydro-2-deoxygluconokinase